MTEIKEVKAYYYDGKLYENKHEAAFAKAVTDLGYLLYKDTAWPNIEAIIKHRQAVMGILDNYEWNLKND